MRLNKFLAEKLGISRRQADDLIAAGVILVNEKVANLGEKLDFSDKVCYNGKMGVVSELKRRLLLEGIRLPDEVFAKLDTLKDGVAVDEVEYVYLGMNKPVGYVCSKRRQGEAPTIFELLPPEYRDLKTVGRLDKDSSGMILLTNDGDFAFQMTHPKFAKTKIYEVELDKRLEALHQQEIADFGIEIGDGVSRLGLEEMDVDSDNGGDKEDHASHENDRRHWRVTMHEGRNRQIRRTFGALGYQVIKLHRTKFGPYRLNGLKSGEFEVVPKV